MDIYMFANHVLYSMEIVGILLHLSGRQKGI